MAYTVALILEIYSVTGVLFAAAFIARGAHRLDRNVDGAPWTFRLIIAPGVVALWPLLLSRWLQELGAR